MSTRTWFTRLLEAYADDFLRAELRTILGAEVHMGNFAINIKAVGGHGCDRKAKEGEPVARCDHKGCPDCAAARFVDELKAYNSVEEATLTHWPGEPSEVVDDLANGVRKSGSFG